MKRDPELCSLSEGEETAELSEGALKRHTESLRTPPEKGVEQQQGKLASDFAQSLASARIARSNTSSRFRRQMEIERLRAEEAAQVARAQRIAAELELLEAGSIVGSSVTTTPSQQQQQQEVPRRVSTTTPQASQQQQQQQVAAQQVAAQQAAAQQAAAQQAAAQQQAAEQQRLAAATPPQSAAQQPAAVQQPLQQQPAVQQPAVEQQQAAARPFARQTGDNTHDFSNPFAIGGAQGAPAQVTWSSLEAASPFGNRATATTGAATYAAPFAAAPSPLAPEWLESPPGLPGFIDHRQQAKVDADHLIYGPAGAGASGQQQPHVPPSHAAQVGNTPVLGPSLT